MRQTETAEVQAASYWVRPALSNQWRSQPHFHIDIAKVRTKEGKLHLFVAIDRKSKFAVAQLVGKANRKTAWEFLEHLLESVPHKLHTILTELPMIAPMCEQHWRRYPVCRTTSEPRQHYIPQDAI